MNRKLRTITGAIAILAGVLILIFYRGSSTTYSEQDIPKDIERRILASVDGHTKVSDIVIRDHKIIGKYGVYLYSYRFKDLGEMNGYIIYEAINEEKFTVNSDHLLSFKRDELKLNDGLQYVSLDGYVIICGLIKDEDTNRFTITSGKTEITDTYERNKYFIREYILSNPNEFTIKALEQE
ncbi:hypothetical protein [Paenibacillus sp. IHBB 10380]|uniref:hypothetical protein n=1 Tax=Paenibacillus sp. IHBB 10380 TaxID=1566358 RepID=UPI0005CFB612|nr:hypothetical protein [Paenibacillus sp. IHBB 10380]AJS60441.1 hypothetical protein UB51_20520 [Paenibacillus sp. IHBB 10380]